MRDLDRLFADIDALVDQQLERPFTQRSGYDNNVNQAPCPHCQQEWHGLAITEQMRRMRQHGHVEEDYVYAEDESPIICPGSDQLGPVSLPWEAQLYSNATNQLRNRHMPSFPGGAADNIFTRMRRAIVVGPAAGGEVRPRARDGYRADVVIFDEAREFDLGVWQGANPSPAISFDMSGRQECEITVDYANVSPTTLRRLLGEPAWWGWERGDERQQPEIEITQLAAGRDESAGGRFIRVREREWWARVDGGGAFPLYADPQSDSQCALYTTDDSNMLKTVWLHTNVPPQGFKRRPSPSTTDHQGSCTPSSG